MKRILANVELAATLPIALRTIVDGGFVVKDNCHFLVHLLAKARSARREQFDDCTGYECFVNSVHVEDYDAKDPLSRSVGFIEQVFKAWSTHAPGVSLVGIVSAVEFSVMVKFHAKHSTETWLSDNLEGYEDPIMSVESSENVVNAIQALRGADF
ncbi:hypothetical protein [Trinickia sp. EG282A]|uniref:hypothetical protein n=1 Tax=Trinickia sp. EG282A TaxID=3237013 RepID=UPI0034D364D3